MHLPQHLPQKHTHYPWVPQFLINREYSTYISGKKNLLRLPSTKSTIRSPSSRSPSQAPSPQTSHLPSCTGHNLHNQLANPPASAAKAESSYRGGVFACADHLYKVSSVASLMSTLPYFIHREHLETIKRWIESLSLSSRFFTPPCVLIPVFSDEGSSKDREEQGDDSEDDYKSTAAVRACHLLNMQLGGPKQLKRVVG